MRTTVIVSLSRPSSAPSSVRYELSQTRFVVGRGASRTVLAEGTVDVGPAVGPEALGLALAHLSAVMSASAERYGSDGEEGH